MKWKTVFLICPEGMLRKEHFLSTGSGQFLYPKQFILENSDTVYFHHNVGYLRGHWEVSTEPDGFESKF